MPGIAIPSYVPASPELTFGKFVSIYVIGGQVSAVGSAIAKGTVKAGSFALEKTKVAAKAVAKKGKEFVVRGRVNGIGKSDSPESSQ